MANAIDDGYGIKEDNENDPKFGTYEYFEASHHNFHIFIMMNNIK